MRSCHARFYVCSPIARSPRNSNTRACLNLHNLSKCSMQRQTCWHDVCMPCACTCATCKKVSWRVQRQALTEKNVITNAMQKAFVSEYLPR